MNLVYCNKTENLIEYYNIYVSNLVAPKIPELLETSLISVTINESTSDTSYHAFHLQISIDSSKELARCESYCSSKVVEYQIEYGLTDIATNIEEDKLLCTLTYKDTDLNSISESLAQFYNDLITNHSIDALDFDVEICCPYTYSSLEDTLITIDFYKALSFPDSILLNTIFRFSDVALEEDVDRYNMDYLKLSMLVGKMLNNTSNYKLVLDEDSDISLSKLTESYCGINGTRKTAYIKRKIRNLVLQAHD